NAGRRLSTASIAARSDLPECGRSFAYTGRPVVVAGELAQHRLEILGLAEIAVDRGEAHIGHAVELAHMLHHDLAVAFRRHLGLRIEAVAARAAHGPISASLRGARATKQYCFA